MGVKTEDNVYICEYAWSTDLTGMTSRELVGILYNNETTKNILRVREGLGYSTSSLALHR